MARLPGKDPFKGLPVRAETPFDKTARAAREIIDGDTLEREAKTESLRTARLERQAAARDELEKPGRKASRSSTRY